MYFIQTAEFGIERFGTADAAARRVVNLLRTFAMRVIAPAMRKEDMDIRLENASRKVKCRAGHGAVVPLEIRKTETAIEIESDSL